MRTIPEWQRQAIVRAIVFGDMTLREIAVECGVSFCTVKRVKQELDIAPIRLRERAYG